jgi:hypothetical protein
MVIIRYFDIDMSIIRCLDIDSEASDDNDHNVNLKILEQTCTPDCEQVKIVEDRKKEKLCLCLSN